MFNVLPQWSNHTHVTGGLLPQLMHFCCLEALIIQTYGEYTQPPFVVVGHLVPILAFLPEMQTLRTINLHATAKMRGTSGGIFQELREYKVDELLSRFSKLQSLHFTIRVDKSSLNTWKTKWWLHQLYPSMQKLRGVVSITVDFQAMYVVTIM